MSNIYCTNLQNYCAKSYKLMKRSGKEEFYNPIYEPVPGRLNFARKTSVGDASYTYHRHDGCEVFLFISGRIKFYVEQACYEPAPGSMIILNNNEMHRVESIDDTSYDRIVINVKRSFLDEISAADFSLSDCFYNRKHGRNNLRMLSEGELEEFVSLFEKLSVCRKPGCFGAQILEKSYAALLFLWINKLYQSDHAHVKNTMPKVISGIMKYLSGHPDEPLSLDKLSEEFHMSPNYMSAQFKRHTGFTIRDYFLNLKVSKACELLRNGADVKEACYRSGFRDYANFIRSFKKLTGSTPGKYARFGNREA